MGRLSRRKVRASSLIEAIVSLLVLMIIGGMALNVFVKVNRMAYASSGVENIEQMNTILDSTVRAGDFRDGDFLIRGHFYRKKVSPCKAANHLLLISIEEYVGDKVTGSVKRIVPSNY